MTSVSLLYWPSCLRLVVTKVQPGLLGLRQTPTYKQRGNPEVLGKRLTVQDGKAVTKSHYDPALIPEVLR